MLRTQRRSNKYQLYIVFGLTRSRFQPTIYDTVGEHANHHSTDAVVTDVYVLMYRFGLFFTGLINKKCNLLMIGLDNAGKSTLLSRLSDGRLVQHPPTNKVCKLSICLCNFLFTYNERQINIHVKTYAIHNQTYWIHNGLVVFVENSISEHDGCH
jgi:hypothetical protein